MKKIISTFVTLAMFLSLLPTFANADNNSAFTDVTENDYYAAAAEALAELDILEGYEDGSFGASRDITRAEMAAIICRMLGREADADKAQGSTDFDDVSSSHWASGYINYASDNGIIEGDGDGKFRPEDNVKYEEAVKMVVCSIGLGDDVTADPEDWSKEYLEIADDNGITDDVKGSKGKASPRGDVAVMVYNGLTYNLAAPEASLEGGSYTGTRTVTLSTSTKDAEIYYTTDGTTPTADSTRYTKAISVSKTQTLKAVAVVDGVLVSDVMSVEYTIKASSGGGGGGSSSSTKYTVSFDLNYDGATDAPESQRVKKGDYAIMPDSPERDGFVFVGWYLDKEYTELYDFINQTVTKDFTLFARWVDITDTTDTDGDGLTDPVEEFYGTDKLKVDTDGDGLSDYVELAVLELDPLKSDSDENGINDGDEDTDNDGLTNLYEITLGTDPAISDTDGDGLSDGQENNTYNTNPINEDTDGDGVSDGKEIELGTDPLVAQSTFSLNITPKDTSDTVTPSVSIELSGEQVETLSVDKVNNDTLFPDDMPGYLGAAYDFNVDGNFDKADISFEFDVALLNNNDFEPVIYYFNETTQELEELPTTIIGNVATTTVTHFSTYILINRKVYQKSFTWEDVWHSDSNFTNVEIILVIDDSGSMDWNDPSNQRLSVAQSLVDNLPEDSKVGIVRFSKSSPDILTKSLLSDKDKAKSYLTTSYFHSSGGTYMYNAINSSFDLFESTADDTLRMMIVLSDGETDDTSKHSSVITAANENKVKIYTVGLGESSSSYFNKYLKPLANNTAGAFYLASDATQLADIYKDISKKIDIETDSDNDGVPDYYEDNLVLFNGVNITLDKNNPDSDGDGILDGKEVELKYTYNEDRTKVIVTGKINSDPLNIDTDGDGLLDADDDKPLIWNVCDRDLATFAALVYKSDDDYNSGNIDKEYFFLNYMDDDELNIIREKWDLIESLTMEQWVDIDTYFEASTYKNGNSVVISIRGTDENFGEWVNNFLGYGVFNWHVEESYAKKYAEKVAKRYPNCDLYITGHSLGGYLAQHAATALYDAGYSSSVKRISYFNGMGLDTKFLFFDSMVDEQKALTHYDNNNKLYCYRIDGDVVSALGEHFTTPIPYPPTQAAINNHKGKHGDTQVEFKLWYLLSPLSAAIDAIKAGGAMTMEYLWYTHETDSFFYHLTQGTRNYQSSNETSSGSHGGGGSSW